MTVIDWPGKAHKGGAVVKARSVYQIEGEAVTVYDIAARLGISPSAARYRLHKFRGTAGPITWTKLDEEPPP